MPPIVYVDADGCPVKDEIYRVATRHGVAVKLVANAGLRVPEAGDVQMILVDDGFDAADDWIVEHARANDIVITTDIPLAARCVEKNARVLSPTGRVFTEDSIGGALANREFLAQMREHNLMSGGPAPFSKQDRSRFLQRLDEALHAARRANP